MEVLALVALTLATAAAQNVFVATPSVMRLGVQESVVIAVHGTDQGQRFELTIEDHPGRRRKLYHHVTDIKPSNPKIIHARISPTIMQDLLSEDVLDRNFVNLTVMSPSFHKSVILPVSNKVGYVFIQTDKPIYTPKQQVQFRIIALKENGKPSDERLKLHIKNPKGIVVKEDDFGGRPFTKPEDYIHTLKYMFPAYPLAGLWSASILHGYKFQQNTTVQFELQEYVLPTFIVKIDAPEVIMPNEENIHISVTANYVYGKPVKGMVAFRLGVKDEAPDVTYFSALYAIKLTDGAYDAVIPTAKLKQHSRIGWFPAIEGSHFVVEATVTDEATGEKEIAINANGKFSTSPFIISFRRCFNDFKPGLISVIEADINYASGKPAAGIETIINAGADGEIPMKIAHPISVSDKDGKLWYEIQPEIHHKVVNVTITSNDPRYPNNQAEGHHILNKFTSETNAYIAITRKSSERPKPGELFRGLIFVQPTTISNVYFMVISKGKILDVTKFQEGSFRVQKVEFPITQEMVPSFRLLVFAEHEKELITDSLRVEVANMCDPKADVKLTVDNDAKTPGSTVTVGLEGTKSTLVGLLAVDSAVYGLSERDRLTRSKMFKSMDSHDLGCGPGGGLTTDSVLRNAGIVMLTNNYDGTAMVSACEEKVRKKREVISSMLGERDGILRECCALGISHDPYGRNCGERTEIVKKRLGDQDRNCSQAFLECCLEGREKDVSEMAFTRPKTGQTARVGGKVDEGRFVSIAEEESMEGDVAIRSEFIESWMLNEIVIRSDRKEEHKFTLPDSITTWVIQAVAVSKDHGMCVAVPKNLKTFKNVFIQMTLPYAVVRNEQIEIRATVFNYGERNVSAIVYMYGVENLCSGSQEGEKSERIRLVILPHSSETAAFPVIPLTEGTFDIEVVALSFSGSDRVIKKLNVIPEGRPVEDSITVILDPSNQQRRKRRDVYDEKHSDSIDESQHLQLTTVKLRAPPDFIPGTESCVISALGDQFGPTISTSLDNPENLIDKPRGCSEQAMIYLAPTLYTMRYLKGVDKVTPEIEAKGYEQIREGYDLMLTHRKEDGSFGAWKHTPSSTWLTAFITKIFCQASQMVHIDEEVMCSGLRWLVTGIEDDGSFVEKNPIYHTEMMGGVKGKVPLTAFVLITLAECTCNDIPNIHILKARALSFLEDHHGELSEPLPTAITAYALALMDSELKHGVNDKLLSLATYDEGSNTMHWQTESNAHDVETTGYGLLTQLMLLKMDKSNSIVNWLNTKRMASGSFQSTQDTVVGLQALSEYVIRAKTPGLNLVSNITSSNDINVLKSFQFDEKNSLVLQEYKINKLDGTLFINTAGQGIGFLNVKLRYNVPHPPEKFQKFDVTVKVNEAKREEFPVFPQHENVNSDHFLLPAAEFIRGLKKELEKPPSSVGVAYELDGNKNIRGRIGRPPVAGIRRVKREDAANNSNLIYKVTICIRYLGNHEDGMTIIDAGIFSGFRANKDDLKQLVEDENLIDTYEPYNRGIIFYLRRAPKEEPFCFDFRIIRDFIIGNMRSTIIKVYLYYDPDESSTIFYSSDQNSPLLRKICNGGICQCAEGGCPPKRPFAKTGGSREKLKLSACEDHDYVWIVRVLEPVTRVDGFLKIKVLVKEVIKEGIEKKSLVENEVRTFLARDSCTSAELGADKEYMIMGKDGKKYENEKGELWHRYILDKTSKIHIWTDMSSSAGNNVIRVLHWLKLKLTQKGCDL